MNCSTYLSPVFSCVTGAVIAIFVRPTLSWLTRVEYKGRYGLRHGFCFALANGVFGEDWSKDEAREMMRHSDPMTIETYWRLRPGRLHKKAQGAVIPELRQVPAA